MKRKEPKTVRVSGEDIVIRANGDVEARDCSKNLLGVVPARILDQIVKTATIMKNSPGGLKGYETNVDWDQAPLTVTIQLGEPEFTVKELARLLQQKGQDIVLGPLVPRKELKALYDQMMAARDGVNLLELDSESFNVGYTDEGAVEFNSGDRTYEHSELLAMQRISQLMRNGNSRKSKKVRSPQEGHAPA